MESSIIGKLRISSAELEEAQLKEQEEDEKNQSRQYVVMGQAAGPDSQSQVSMGRSMTGAIRISSRRQVSDSKVSTPTTPQFKLDKVQRNPSIDQEAMLKKATTYSTTALHPSKASNALGESPTALGFIFESSFDKISRKDSIARITRRDSNPPQSYVCEFLDSQSKRGSVSSDESVANSVMSTTGLVPSDSPASDYSGSKFFYKHTANTGAGGDLATLKTLDVPGSKIEQTNTPVSANWGAGAAASECLPKFPKIMDKNPFLNMLLENQSSNESLKTLGNESIHTLGLPQRSQSPCEYDAELDLLSIYLAE